MAHSYTPGLKVLKNSKILKDRRLPLKGIVKSKIGDKVMPDDIVANTNLPGNVQMVNIANQLNIDATDINKYMLKKVGEQINKNEMIAETEGIFGFFKSSALSPVDGTLESISDVTGQIVLRESPIPVEVDAYIEGKIDNIISDEGVIIKANGVFIQGIFGIGGESRGEIVTVVENRDSEVTKEMITEEHKEKILIGGSFLSLDAYKKAIECEVAGVIVGGFNYYDLEEVLGYTLGVAITGSENLNTSLIVTEGYGKIQMGQQTFELLNKHSGKFASINGATQIRAGVIRPEIIIPIDLNGNNEHNNEFGKSDGMTVGSLVRVIRSPNFGKIGKVIELPPELRKMESETMVRVAIIDIGQSQVEIPRSNLEVVETD